MLFERSISSFDNHYSLSYEKAICILLTFPLFTPARKEALLCCSEELLSLLLFPNLFLCHRARQMSRFSWSLYKALEYLNSKRSDFEIRATFLKRLLQYEIRLFGQGDKQTCTKTWKGNFFNCSSYFLCVCFFNCLLLAELASFTNKNKKKQCTPTESRTS